MGFWLKTMGRDTQPRWGWKVPMSRLCQVFGFFVLHLVSQRLLDCTKTMYIYIHSLSLVYNLQKDKYFFLSHQNLGIAILKWTINGI